MFNRSWRIIKVLYLKLLRTQGTPHSIALAVAIGILVGCIIPIGLWGQTVVAIAVAIKFKTNPGIAYAATWISNPYSVIFMYPAYCYVGSFIIGSSMTFAQIKADMMRVIHDFSWAAIKGIGTQLVVSYIIGAVIFGIVLSLIGYYFTYRFIKRYKEAKQKRRLKKIKLNKIKKKEINL